MIRLLVAVLIVFLSANGAMACRLALVLAMDVSSSVDATEDALQRGGLASALVSPQVQAAFLATDDPVALAVFEWSGRYNQTLLLDWVLVASVADLTAAANAIARSERGHSDYPTAMGHAVGYAATMLQRAPLCDAQTIDVSGDGPNNDGFAPLDAYGAFPFDAVTVNGLVVSVPGEAINGDTQFNLTGYYARNVIRGPGAFIEIANGFDDFSRAIKAKLIRELGVRVIGHAPSFDDPHG